MTPRHSEGNLTLPFVGIVEAVPTWIISDGIDKFWTSATILAVGLSLATLWKGSPLARWLVAPWLALAFMSSHLVWDFGNNSIRAFA
ncbi:MAG: hypothetical protein KY393_08455, partial [Actinobacteria bacterium]|nr:hypothetical protein [Actinomycetota bacterium]